MQKSCNLLAEGFKSRLLQFLFFLAVAILPSFAIAQKTWDGGASTSDWNDAANWDPDGVPSSTDDVSIGAFTVNITSLFNQAKSLSLTGTTLNIDIFGDLSITTGSTYALSLNSSTLTNNGYISIANCAGGIALQGTGSLLQNDGTIDLDNFSGNGLVFVSGASSCSVQNGSRMTFDNGTVSTASAVLFQAGGMTFTSNGTIDIGATSLAGTGIGLGPTAAGSITNNGTLNILSTGASKAGIQTGFIPGSVINNASGTINFGAGIGGATIGGFNLALTNDGILNTNRSGTVNAIVKGSGSFGGSNSFDNNNNFLPGNTSTAGCFQFNSGYSNISGSPTPVTLIEIGGTTPCTQHDKINVTGTANLAGTLSISLINGFTPTAGQTYTVLEATNRVGTYSTVNYPTVSGINWTISYTSNAVIINAMSALPVELTDFSAILDENRMVRLAWRTASEQMNQGFYVEKSVDTKHWTDFGFVEGYGNSNNAHIYSYSDIKPTPGLNYYRLRQIDFDGKEEVSNIQSVFVPSESIEDEFSIFPNPSSGWVQINGDFSPETNVYVFDETGRMIEQFNLTESTQLDLSTLMNGLYSLTVYDGRKLVSQRFLIEK